MELKCIINGRPVAADVAADLSLLQFLRAQGYKSVKCGCETTNCGICTAFRCFPVLCRPCGLRDAR